MLGLIAFITASAPNGNAAEQVVELPPQTAKVIRGIVVFPDGSPVKGARVVELSADKGGMPWNLSLPAAVLPSIENQKSQIENDFTPSA